MINNIGSEKRGCFMVYKNVTILCYYLNLIQILLEKDKEMDKK